MFEPPVDLVLCSDCIYDEDLVDILADSIVALSNPETEIYVAYQHRRQFVEKKFLECAQERKLRVVHVSSNSLAHTT